MDGKAPVQVSVADIRPTYDLITSLYKAAGTGLEVERGSIVAGDPYYEKFAAVAASRALSRSPHGGPERRFRTRREGARG